MKLAVKITTLLCDSAVQNISRHIDIKKAFPRNLKIYFKLKINLLFEPYTLNKLTNKTFCSTQIINIQVNNF